MELEESGSLASDYTTKLQSSKVYDTGTKHRSMEQDRKPEVISPIDGQLIYNKGGKTINGEDRLFNKWRWDN